MGEKKSHVHEGIVLIASAVAFAVAYFTVHKYYGPVILLCVGAIMIALSYLAEKEKRRAPVAGVIAVVLGISLLIELLSGGQEVIITALLLVIVAGAGVRMLFD
ncbi:MAG: hypothetical protein NT045_02415 [Candidatus Aureabacteria bacterium]|nr:hypothetical protein [Candidatus Auribacterota bacterium]